MSEVAPKNPLFRILAAIVSGLVWLLLWMGVLWAFGALWFDLPAVLMPRVAAWVFFVSMVCCAVFLRPFWRAKLAIAMVLLVVVAWWLGLQPKQHRDWRPDVAQTSRAEVDGDWVTLHNVRNADYRTETDYTVRHETRRLDMRNLRGMDVFITYWGSPYMAHPIVSYDFGPDGHICFSIETRNEKGEGYSAIRGLYRQFELIYVVADERDVIRLRTNYRKGEEVYLYRLNAPRAKESFMEYVHTVNELNASPRWYNAVTNNCTTAIRHQRAKDVRKPFDWRMLVNGFGDEMMYENGAIRTDLPFAELKKRAHINAKARAADQDVDFSGKIRADIP